MSYQSRQIFKYSVALAIGMSVGILATRATTDPVIITKTKTVEVMPKDNYCAMTVDYDNGIIDRFNNRSTSEAYTWLDKVTPARAAVAQQCATSIKGGN